MRFIINEYTKSSPFYLLYNCDPALPIDNILKSGRGTTQDRFSTTTQVICNGASISEEG